MAGQQVARVGDLGIGTCPCHTHPQAYTTIFISGSPNVTADGLQVMRIGDLGVASCGHATMVTTGSSIVDADSIGIHRVGDQGLNCGMYICITGSPNVDAL